MKTAGPVLVVVAGGCVYLWLMGFSPTTIQNATWEPEYRTVTMNTSAYCPCEKCCGQFSDGVTASGHVIQRGDKFVAAPPEYPFVEKLQPNTVEAKAEKSPSMGSVSGVVGSSEPTHDSNKRWPSVSRRLRIAPALTKAGAETTRPVG